MTDTRNAKINFNKSGGNASKNSYTSRLTIPTSWIKAMGITQDDRNVVLKFENGVITVKKIES